MLITINITGRVYPSVGESLRYSFFRVGSVITTTGGIKCIRVLLLFKIIKREITKIIHLRAVQTVKINGRIAEEETLSGAAAFFFFAMLITAVSVLLVSLEGKDIVTSTTAVITCINNVGPGLGLVGPKENFAGLSVLSKGVLSVCMIIGRLEIYPVMLLLCPFFWKRNSI